MKKWRTFSVAAIISVAAVLLSGWHKVCYFSGKAYAQINLLSGSLVTYDYGLAKPINDTTWVMDSLMYQSMGYDGRGTGCVIGSSFATFIDGYNSTYRPHLEAKILPDVRKKAVEILQARPTNWKDELDEDQKKLRLLLFER